MYMVDEQLKAYIQKARQSAMNDEQIKSELMKTGWQEAQIQEALQPSSIDETAANTKKMPIMNDAQKKSISRVEFSMRIANALIVSFIVVLFGTYWFSFLYGSSCFFLICMFYPAIVGSVVLLSLMLARNHRVRLAINVVVISVIAALLIYNIYYDHTLRKYQSTKSEYNRSMTLKVKEAASIEECEAIGNKANLYRQDDLLGITKIKNELSYDEDLHWERCITKFVVDRASFSSCTALMPTGVYKAEINCAETLIAYRLNEVRSALDCGRLFNGIAIDGLSKYDTSWLEKIKERASEKCVFVTK